MNRKILLIGLVVMNVLAFIIILLFVHRCSSDDLNSELSDSVRNENKIDDGITRYREISYPTPNYDRNKRNKVQGVILHHTAEPTVKRSLEVLTIGERHVGTHVVIDTDGTRYIMCEPEVVTYHAGNSILNGVEGCNDFTIGIEFQGNTLEKPLTQDQIKSGIEYLLPLIAKYNIPTKNIVTHEMVRMEYKKRYPQKRCSGKVDITQIEYKRFMTELQNALKRENK